MGGVGLRYRFPERWKKSAGAPTIQSATVAAKIQENATRSRRTKAQTAPRRSTYSSNGTICGNAGAPRDTMRPAQGRPPTDKIGRASCRERVKIAMVDGDDDS